jgi:hypothetical protein
MMVKWIKVANGYFTDFGVPKLDDGQKEIYDKVTKIAFPLLKQLDDTTRTLLLPSLADGQVGLVLDAKITSKQWVKGMPDVGKPLPMLEPAMIFGVSDSEKLAKAMSQYRSIANEAFGKIKQVKGEDAPDLNIPEPQTRKVKAGTIYFYPLPGDLGVDKQIAPNAGLSDKVAVVTISMTHSERLLAQSPLKVQGLLADTSKPLVSAAFTNCSAIVDTLSPWIEYGAKAALILRRNDGGEDEQANKQVDEAMKQVRIVLDALKVFKTYTSVSYFEEGALISHGELIVEDLPKRAIQQQSK